MKWGKINVKSNSDSFIFKINSLQGGWVRKWRYFCKKLLELTKEEGKNHYELSWDNYIQQQDLLYT